MTSGARIFSKQCPKVSNPFSAIGGSADVDQAMAAGLCAGMKREHYLAARFKWALDWSVSSELERLLQDKGEGFAKKEQWKLRKEETRVRAIAGLALAEMANPSFWSIDANKAMFIGVDKSGFSRVWKKRYNLLYATLEDWANSAYSYVMMRQRYEDEATDQ